MSSCSTNSYDMRNGRQVTRICIQMGIGDGLRHRKLGNGYGHPHRDLELRRDDVGMLKLQVVEHVWFWVGGSWSGGLVGGQNRKRVTCEREVKEGAFVGVCLVCVCIEGWLFCVLKCG